ncbi:MAG TPA: HEAT repeat domain-containing protein [Thermoanaerobaculia bacterium]|nr:HEAT repeat domain-containing protein [Thermoanaerobaculia bacterium]
MRVPILVLALLLSAIGCNAPEDVPRSDTSPTLNADMLRLHLLIQGADPAFVKELDRTPGFANVDRVVDRLIQMLHTDPDAKRKAQASACLGALSPNSIRPLVQALDSKDGDVAMYAAGAFVKMGPNGRQAVPALIKALNHEQWAVRAFAAKALGAIGPDLRSKAALNKSLSDSNPFVQKAAADALQKIQAPAK